MSSLTLAELLMMHGEEEVKPGLTKFPGKLQGLVMTKAGLVAAANWLLGPLSFKKQIHGMDCNGNGYVVFPASLSDHQRAHQ